MKNILRLTILMTLCIFSTGCHNTTLHKVVGKSTAKTKYIDRWPEYVGVWLPTSDNLQAFIPEKIIFEEDDIYITVVGGTSRVYHHNKLQLAGQDALNFDRGDKGPVLVKIDQEGFLHIDGFPARYKKQAPAK